MNLDAFMMEIRNPVMNQRNLGAIFLAADADEQSRIIEALPGIAMDLVHAGDGARLIQVLSIFVEFAERVLFLYRGDALALYWKEQAVSLLLYQRVLSKKVEGFDDILHRRCHLEPEYFYQSFGKIIKMLLETDSINLSQIKNEYGTYILSSIIQRYPDLFHLALERGAYVNGVARAPLNDLLPPPLPAMHRSRKTVPLRSLRIDETVYDLIFVEADRFHPLMACIIQIGHDPLNAQLREILYVLLNHPDLELDIPLRMHPPLEIARHLGVFDVVNEVMLLPTIKTVQDEFIMRNFYRENTRFSLSPYAYGLSRQAVLGDGDCLYHAIALHTDRTASDLRLAAADYIEAGHLNEFLPQAHTQYSYAAAVREGQWGDHLEITALMHILGRPIVVLHENGTRPTMPAQMGNFPGEPIFISYNGINHYTGLVPSRGYESRDILSTMFPLLGRVRQLPGDLKMYMFSFFSQPEQVLLSGNHELDAACDEFVHSILNPSEKRKRSESQSDTDTDTDGAGPSEPKR